MSNPTEKMEALARLAGVVAHDFNNFLTAILINSRLLTSELAEGDPRKDEALEIGEAAARAAKMTRQLLLFAGKRCPLPPPIDVGAAISTLTPLKTSLAFQFEIQAPERHVFGHIEEDHLRLIIQHLIDNVRDFCGSGGKMTLTVSEQKRDEKLYAVVEAKDNGPGFSSEALAHAFEPYFSTKEKGQGTGVGLATVFGLIHRLGGFCEAANAEPGGAIVRVAIPSPMGSTK